MFFLNVILSRRCAGGSGGRCWTALGLGVGVGLGRDRLRALQRARQKAQDKVACAVDGRWDRTCRDAAARSCPGGRGSKQSFSPGRGWRAPVGPPAPACPSLRTSRRSCATETVCGQLDLSRRLGKFRATKFETDRFSIPPTTKASFPLRAEAAKKGRQARRRRVGGSWAHAELVHLFGHVPRAARLRRPRRVRRRPARRGGGGGGGAGSTSRPTARSPASGRE